LRFLAQYRIAPSHGTDVLCLDDEKGEVLLVGGRWRTPNDIKIPGHNSFLSVPVERAAKTKDRA
jgi:hypothetical protein